MASGDTTQGRRVDDVAELTTPGDYHLCDSTNPDGTPSGHRELWFVLPDSSDGKSKRHIHDGPDGWVFADNGDTVTVTPSIFAHHLKRDPDTGKTTTEPGWHGYLTDGVWREC